MRQNFLVSKLPFISNIQISQCSFDFETSPRETRGTSLGNYYRHCQSIGTELGGYI